VAEWWQELFASAAWQAVQLGWAAVEDEVEQTDRLVAALGLEPGMRVLDVPCGTGRIAIELAARGYDVVGVDMTARFLDEGRIRGPNVTFVHGDMRTLWFVEEFDAAICFWGSFGYFDDDGNRAQATSAARALRDGGTYLIDTPTLETILPRFQERSWFVVEDTLVLEERAFHAASSRIETTWTFVRGGERATRRSSVRIYSLRELTDLLRDVGFGTFAARDDDLEEFGVGSQRLWLSATKG
jgi:SAM-dependent methyltransferase